MFSYADYCVFKTIFNARSCIYMEITIDRSLRHWWVFVLRGIVFILLSFTFSCRLLALIWRLASCSVW
jgi:hypothetical protein